MKKWKVVLPVAAVLLFAGQVVAQTEKEESLRASEAAMDARELEMEEKLRAAEARMAEAAREIAEEYFCSRKVLGRLLDLASA